MTGFDLFSTRRDSIENAISEFEIQTKKRLPPIFKICHNTLNLCDNLTHKTILKGKETSICRILFKNEFSIIDENFICFDRFLTISELLERDRIIDLSDYEKLKLRVIADCTPANIGIFIGTSELSLDEIWLYDYEYCYVENPVKIAANIFEFIRMLYTTPVFNPSTQSKLYKKYGEGIWKFTKNEIEDSPVPDDIADY